MDGPTVKARGGEDCNSALKYSKNGWPLIKWNRLFLFRDVPANDPPEFSQDLKLGCRLD
jgi:hypothetical protein